jgi:hypothetical protein
MDPKLVIGAALAVVVAALVWRVVAVRAPRGRSRNQGEGHGPANPEFERLLRMGDQRSGSPVAAAEPARQVPPSTRGPSASDLLESVRRLKSKSAGWPEILATINPRGDSTIGQLLLSIRGPHQFVPHVALNVIEDGCQRVLKVNAGASVAEALRDAVRRSDVMTTVRD